MARCSIRFRSFSYRDENVRAYLSMARPSVRASRAFERLHEQIADDMTPYMPSRTGGFRQRTRAANAALAGSGWLYAGVGPMGAYLYRGRTMVDAATGRGPMVIPGVGPRFRKGAALVPGPGALRYSAAGTGPAWFESAKAARLQSWIDQIQNTLDGR